MFFQAREYLQNKLSATAEKYNTVSFYVTESQTRVPVVIAHYLNGYQEVIIQFFDNSICSCS